MAEGRDIVAESMVYPPDGGEPYLDAVKYMNLLRPRGGTGQTIGDYFSGIKSKRDEDERRAAAQELARAEEEEWLGVGEQPLSPWGQRMLSQGWVELTPGNWMPPEEAHAMDITAPSFDYYEAPPAIAQYRKNAAQQYLNKDWPEW